MSLPVIVLRVAEADLAEAKTWYENNQRGCSEKFRLGVEEAIERIACMPAIHAGIYKGVRRSFFDHFQKN